MGTELLRRPTKSKNANGVHLHEGSFRITGDLQVDGSFDLGAVVAELSTGVVAAAGSGQSTYAALSDQVSIVTGADGTKGVALPAAAEGKAMLIINADASNLLKVSPVNSGNDAINSLTAGTGVFDLGPGRAAWFAPTSATQWYVGGEDAGLATPAEIDRVADVSARLVTLSGATSISVATHEGKTCLLTGTGSSLAQTLPAATGSGARFRFVVGAVNTSNHVIKVTTDDVFRGQIDILDNDSNALTAYACAGTDDTITLNGTTTGGQVGDFIEVEDIAADTWAVRGKLICPAGSNVADMLSATVT